MQQGPFRAENVPLMSGQVCQDCSTFGLHRCWLCASATAHVLQLQQAQAPSAPSAPPVPGYEDPVKPSSSQRQACARDRAFFLRPFILQVVLCRTCVCVSELLLAIVKVDKAPWAAVQRNAQRRLAGYCAESQNL